MKEEMRLDERIFIIGEDVDQHGGVFRLTEGILEEFGQKRLRGTPISEAAFTGLATGAAMKGFRPIVEFMYFDFVGVAMDQVVNQAAKIHYMSGGQFTLPMVLRGQIGSGTREAAQHSQHLENWFAQVPGLKIVMPSNAYDAKGLMISAIRDNNPVIYLESRNLYYRNETVPEGTWTVPIGIADVKRNGSDITVVALSDAVNRTLKAAEQLKDTINVEVIDPRTIVPLDIETILESINKTGCILIVHDAVTQSSMGAEIVRRVVEEGFDLLDVEPVVLGAAAVPTPFSPVLEDACIPRADKIANAIRKMAAKKGKRA